MQKIVLMAVASLALVACGTSTKPESTAQAVPVCDCVEVLYFHGKRCCATCLAIDKNVS